MEASAIAPPDAAATNVASFGRQRIQAESTASNGHTQNQPGHLDGALIALDRRYRDLAGGVLGQPLRHPVGAADLRAVEAGCTAAERAVLASPPQGCATRCSRCSGRAEAAAFPTDD
jgi:hypothetical protein